MPNWNVHLEVGKRLNKKLNLDNDLFMLGNILPDINNNYIVKGISKVLTHSYTHYTDNNIYSYKNFYEEYKNKLNNPLILGYYTHLYTDFLFNNNFYTKVSSDLDHDILRKMKQNDFKKFNNKFLDNKLDIDIDKCLENVKVLERINIDKNDLELVVDYLNNRKKEELTYNFYTEEELDNLLDKTVDKIYNEIIEII